MKTLMTANYAAAHAARLCRVEVMAAYPISPQTTIIEKLAEFCDTGQMPATLLKMESEHSVMASCIGASSGGARVFTATSGQGLALMHEVLHWAAGARLPIVMVNVNRSLAAPWSLGTDQHDSLSQRDTGWLQFYCMDAQEVLDTVIQAFKISERVLLPSMIVVDGFLLSHTAEPIDVPEIEQVDAYLGPRRTWHRMDLEEPHSFGAFAPSPIYFQFRKDMHSSMDEVRRVVAEDGAEFERLFGRRYGLVEPYRLDDRPDVAIIASATVASTVRLVVDEQRSRGRSVGMLRIRSFRPFPCDEIRSALAGVKKVIVLDRNISFGHEGVFSQEVKAALYGRPEAPQVYGFVIGLGGLDVTPATVAECLQQAELQDPAPPEVVAWMG